MSANQIPWSRLLIQIHIQNGKQSRSRSVGFFRSQLIWIYTVCKGRVNPGSAGQELKTQEWKGETERYIRVWHMWIHNNIYEVTQIKSISWNAAFPRIHVFQVIHSSIGQCLEWKSVFGKEILTHYYFNRRQCRYLWPDLGAELAQFLMIKGYCTTMISRMPFTFLIAVRTDRIVRISSPLCVHHTARVLSIAITKCLCNFDPLKPILYIVKLGFTGVHIIFLISAQKHRLWYSLEPPRRSGSTEYPQSMFWSEIWKISEFFIWKFSFFVVFFFGGKIFSIFE